MNNDKLAILGGSKVINHEFEKYNSIGDEELKAATEVIRSGNLSSFLGCWDKAFYGGLKVQEFENACKEYFGVKHAVTVNSWTSGLVCALGAIGIEPGDEVIVSPWTMCATATAILHWNAIPVFADILSTTFNLDIESVEKNISSNTKAILAVDIFGQSSDIESLRYLADKYSLRLITDSAQSPGAFTKGKKTGTFADVGGFSLNYHKHIHTGEGGILVTNNDELCERLQLIRNHAEAVVKDKGVDNLSNMIGHNFRLGEIEAAIGIEQLKKLDNIILRRQEIANYISEGLKDLKGFRLPYIEESNTHAYYIYPIILDTDILDVNRKIIIKALEAEGLKGFINGYANLHLLPLFQEKIAYGSKGFPWSSDICKREINYKKGICPIAEQLHDKNFIGFEMCLYELKENDLKLLIKAFKKVWNGLDKLKDLDHLI